MSYFPNINISYKDSPDKDAFGRLRVSEPVTLFDSQFQYDTQPLIWDSVTVATGSVTHLPNESSVRLRVAASGDSVIRQSKMYARYRSGKSLLGAFTFVLGAATANVTKRVGYFDASNGIFLEQTGSGLSIVKRTYTSGSPVDTAIVQANWNIDPFDGTGPSQITLDPTKAQILMLDLQWLGAGRARIGFDIDGVFYPAHQFLNANSLSTVYMSTANLPVRYEIVATGAIGGNVDLIQICSMIASEGGFEQDRGIPRGVGNGINAISVTTRRPILSIRPRLTFNSIANRGLVFPEGVDLTAATNNSYWELVWGGTLTTPSWVNVSSNSIVEYDIASATIAGGEVLAAGHVLAGGGSARLQLLQNIISRIPLTLSYDGTSSTTLSLVCTSFTGTSSVTGAMNWRELF